MNVHQSIDMSMHGTARRELPANDRYTDDDVLLAEQRVVATIMVSNERMNECELEPEDFREDVHRIIFDTARRLIRSNQVCTGIALKPYLPKVMYTYDAHSKRRVEADFSPVEYVSRLTSFGYDPTTAAKFEEDMQTLKAVALARSLEQVGTHASSVAAECHGFLTLIDEIDRLEGLLREARARFSETTSHSSAGSSYLATFQASARRDGVVGVPIAMQEIAKVLSEPVFEAGNLYGLLSSSGEGKSSLTMQLIYHAVEQGHPVLFLSYDQSASQCVRQMIAQVHGIDIRQQRDPSRMMSPSEQETCVHFAMKIDRQPLDIIRCQREGVTQLVAYARRFIKKHGNGRTPFIVIDHIGKVKPRDPKLSADRISGEVTVELKALADETSSAVLILNQRNSFGTRRDNPRPIAADLYGGEGARADYDAVLYLYRAEKYKAEREKIAASDSDWKKINKVFTGDVEGIAEIGSIKVRFGDPTITETLKFEARYTRYVSHREPEPQGRLM